jgi:TDG/mug DNA glycosylase family protein
MALPIQPLKASFAPIAGPQTRLLILGSLPGEVSLRRAQYYGHPQNQFWRLLGRVLGAELPQDYEARLEALQAAGVGLWDVVRTARRAGSLDAAIRDHEPNPLGEFAATLPKLRAIAFNGAAASAIGRKQLEGVAAELITLPSSSPAHTLAFDRKAESWLALRDFLT